MDIKFRRCRELTRQLRPLGSGVMQALEVGYVFRILEGERA